jgi:hypothetical protein
VISRLLILTASAAAFWLLVGLPARHLGGGDLALIYCGTGLLLCLVPAAITLVVVARANRTSPHEGALAVLASTGIRMFAVLAAGWVLTGLVPLYQSDRFWAWLVVSYLFTLAVETALVLTAVPPSGKPS